MFLNGSSKKHYLAKNKKYLATLINYKPTEKNIMH